MSGSLSRVEIARNVPVLERLNLLKNYANSLIPSTEHQGCIEIGQSRENSFSASQLLRSRGRWRASCNQWRRTVREGAQHCISYGGLATRSFTAAITAGSELHKGEITGELHIILLSLDIRKLVPFIWLVNINHLRQINPLSVRAAGRGG